MPPGFSSRSLGSLRFLTDGDNLMSNVYGKWKYFAEQGIGGLGLQPGHEYIALIPRQ